MNNQERKDLTKLFWRFMLSSILIALSGCLGNVVDAIIVGNLINEDGVSAINLTRTVIQLMFTLNMLISSGGGLVVGFALGQKNYNRVSYVFTLTGCISLGLGLMFTLFSGILMPEASARLLCHNAHLLPLTRDYLQVMMLGAPAYLLFWHLSMMANVDGSPRLVSIAVLVDNAVNLLLDIVFIKYFGWGIAGSSAATVSGHLVGIGIMLLHFRYKNCHLGLSFRSPRRELGNVLSQGAPLAVASVCLTTLLFCANSIVLSSAGRTGSFVFAVCMNLLQIYNLYLAGTTRTLQTLGAVQAGEKNEEGFWLVMKKSFMFMTVTMLITCALVWIEPQWIARLFGASEPAMLTACDEALRVFALSFMPFCYIYSLMIVYKLFSHHKMALLLSFMLSLTVIPVLWLIARYAPRLIWYSYLIAYLIELAVIFVCHKAFHAHFRFSEAEN